MPLRDLCQLEEQVDTIREQVTQWEQSLPAEPAPAVESNVAELCKMLDKLHEAEEELREVQRD